MGGFRPRRGLGRFPSRGGPTTVQILMALVVVLTGCSGGGGAGGSSESGFVAGDSGLTMVPPEERRPAPVVEGPGLDGGTVTTAHPGKVVVINVWGSWCAPCRKEAPALQAASQQTADLAQFIGIDTRDAERAPAQAFQRTFGITYPSIYDPDGRTLLQFSGELPPSGIPSTLVIDPQGRIAARQIGEIDQNTLVGLVEDAAAGR